VNVRLVLLPEQILAVPLRLPVGKDSTVSVTAGVAVSAQPGAVVSVTTTLYWFPFNPFTLLILKAEVAKPVYTPPSVPAPIGVAPLNHW